MALFSSSAYTRYKNEVDAYPVLEKGRTPLGSVENLMDNVRGGAMLIEKIKQAARNGEISESQATELVQRFQARARQGLGM